MSLPEWVGVVVLLWFPAAFALTAAAAGRRGGIRDRCQVLGGAGTAVVGLALGRVMVPWDVVPPALWGVAAALTAWGAITAAVEWRRLPTIAARYPALRVAGTGIGLAFTALVVAAVI